MLDKSNIIASAALVLGLLGSSLPALAGYDYEHETYGGPVQTWCNINPDCNGWNKKPRGPSVYHSNASGARAPVSPKHRPVRKRSQDAKDR
jgi:hypothetical protein